MQSLKDILLGRSVILYDLEYTAWKGSKQAGWTRAGEHREIVELGAIKIVPEKGLLVVKARYSCFVVPNINPTLSDYFITLTGITQRSVDTEGVGFTAMFSEFLNFIGIDTPLLSFGIDDEILVENCTLNHINCTIPASRFINYRSELCTALDIDHATNSSDLPSLCHLDNPFDKHRAIGDVMAQLSVLNHALQKGLLS
jgi:inhibitor of KinA sporulation pathway (predicted exonuclease)